MNSFKVKILNYQRIRKASLEFIPGLNVIVGASNQGKTALNRSLETAIYNIPREDHITLGETQSAVGIQYNGHEVLWRRDKSAASQVSYRIDGKIYQKLGRGQPEEVAKSLGIRELDINEKKFRLNFSKQMSYPFLLDSTPSEMFKFIAQSSGEDNLIDVLKQMKKDINEISSNVKAHEESQKVLGETLNQLEFKYKEIAGRKKYCEEVISIDSKVKEYQWLLDKIDTYKKCKSAVEKMTNSMNYYKSVYNEIASTVSVVESKMLILNNISMSIDSYSTFMSSKMGLKFELDKNKKLILKYEDIDEVYDQYKSIDLVEEKHNSIENSIEEYRNTLTFLKNTKESYSSLKDQISKYNKYIEVIGGILEKTDLEKEELQHLQQAVSDYDTWVLSIKSYKVEIEHIYKQLNDIEKEIKTIGVCPYCGSLLGGSHGEH